MSNNTNDFVKTSAAIVKLSRRSPSAMLSNIFRRGPSKSEVLARNLLTGLGVTGAVGGAGLGAAYGLGALDDFDFGGVAGASAAVPTGQVGADMGDPYEFTGPMMDDFNVGPQIGDATGWNAPQHAGNQGRDMARDVLTNSLLNTY